MQVGNTELAFLDSGDGKPIVLIHGFTGSKQYWEKILPVLSKTSRVIAIDLPGHGESGMGMEKYSIEDMAMLIKKLLDQLQLENVTMFGHSLGGYITLAFAERYSNYLNGFALLHSTANADPEEAKQGRHENAMKIVKEGTESFINGLAQKLFSKDHIELHALAIKKTIEIGLSASIKGVVSALLAMKDRPDRNDVLEKTDKQVLLVAGEQDQIIPPEKTFTVQRNNIDARLIKGAGHMSMYEQPEELARIMNEFLSKAGEE